MDWIDVIILIIAILAAPYYARSLCQWIAGATAPWNRHAAPPEIERLEPWQILQYRARYLEWSRKRERFLETVRPSFPPDSRLISSGPVRVKWDTNLDDFWDALPFSHPIQVDRAHSYVALDDTMKPDLYNSFKERWGRTIRMVNDDGTLDWRKQPTSVGLCHRSFGGTLCAVHRWDALGRDGDVEDQQRAGALVGRLQCWVDPNLLRSNPGFVEERPEFDPRNVWVSNGDGDVCILELDQSVFIVGCPVHHSIVYSNDFAFFSTHGANHWHLEDVDDEATASSVVQRMREFSLEAICEYGGCDATGQDNAALDFEGDVSAEVTG